MHTFFIAVPRTDITELPAEEARHAVQVLRLKAGDRIRLTDGCGGLYLADILEANKKGCRVSILEKEEHEKGYSYRVTLAVAPTKNMNRMEWLVEKATEIGVDDIIPVITFHSERRKLRIDRLERIMVAAMKQSRRTWLPHLHEPVLLEEWLETDFGESQCAMAYISPHVDQEWVHTVKKGKNVIVAIGPEGGFSQEEAELAKAKGFSWVSLGAYRLRTETAALMALHTVHMAQAKVWHKT